MIKVTKETFEQLFSSHCFGTVIFVQLSACSGYEIIG
jgi:hypothetical protein